MTSPGGYSYDQVPYPKLSHYHSHPGSLALIATLVGMKPAPVEHCRVLELGCAAGWNLIPMAYSLPGSDFTGIDLSHLQIKEGHKAAAEFGLKNLHLLQMDLMDVTPEMGKFDYIIAHGVYSWVPPQTQQKILLICKQNLAEQGVAYVSYNTYPGWHLLNIPRGIMHFHTQGITDPQERARAARESVAFYAQAKTTMANPAAKFLQQYQEDWLGSMEGVTPDNDSSLLHDELEDYNLPVYFYQFMAQAENQGLQYLADNSSSKTGSIPAETMNALLQRSTSLVQMEQAMDFLQNRTFRQTMLCHAHVPLNRTITPGMARKFFYNSDAKPVSDHPNLALISVETFTSPDGAKLTIDHPLSKAAMLCLAEASPASFSFDELYEAARVRLQNSPGYLGLNRSEDWDQEVEVLGTNLLQAFSYSKGLVELVTFRDLFTTHIEACPEASLIVRGQAQTGSYVTNLRHERIRLDEMDRFLLIRLDGSRDIHALQDLVVQGPLAEGWFEVDEPQQPLTGDEKKERIQRYIEHKLLYFAQKAMLVEHKQPGE